MPPSPHKTSTHVVLHIIRLDKKKLMILLLTLTVTTARAIMTTGGIIIAIIMIKKTIIKTIIFSPFWKKNRVPDPC